MPLKVCLVVGSDRDTVRCGVKDYALCLAGALREVGVRAELASASRWDVRSLAPLCKRLRAGRLDIMHIQYPSIGFRWSLAPHLLGLMKTGGKTVVTLHDHSTLPRVQRISTYLFGLSADHLLFTTDFEQQQFLRLFSGFAPKHSVIPIGSNVPVHGEPISRGRRVVYFGQIKPAKGIEDFLELARQSTQLERSFQFLVIGSVPIRHSSYFAEIRSQSPAEVEWMTDLPFGTIAEILASSFAAYLPFPDGATYRRGSMLAALANGLPVIAPCGPATPRELADIVLRANGPSEALTHLDNLGGSAELMKATSIATYRFAQRFSWPEIALQHKMVYEGMLDNASVATPFSASA